MAIAMVTPGHTWHIAPDGDFADPDSNIPFGTFLVRANTHDGYHRHPWHFWCGLNRHDLGHIPMQDAVQLAERIMANHRESL